MDNKSQHGTGTSQSQKSIRFLYSAAPFGSDSPQAVRALLCPLGTPCESQSLYPKPQACTTSTEQWEDPARCCLELRSPGHLSENVLFEHECLFSYGGGPGPTAWDENVARSLSTANPQFHLEGIIRNDAGLSLMGIHTMGSFGRKFGDAKYSTLEAGANRRSTAHFCNVNQVCS